MLGIKLDVWIGIRPKQRERVQNEMVTLQIKYINLTNTTEMLQVACPYKCSGHGNILAGTKEATVRCHTCRKEFRVKEEMQ